VVSPIQVRSPLREHNTATAAKRPAAVGIGRSREEHATMEVARVGVGARRTGRRPMMLRNLMGLMPYVILFFAIGTVVALLAIIILIAQAVP